MAEAPSALLDDDDLSAASSRLDASLLRYVLLHRSRMNMLALDRELRDLLGDDGLLRVAPGAMRSDIRSRAEATMQLAVELALATPDIVRWIGTDALRRQLALDAAYYQSTRWSQGLPPALVDDTPDAPALASAFGRYMLRCSRLDEDRLRHLQAGTTPPEDPEFDLAASTLAASYPRLLHIARDVVDRLDPEVTLAQWRDAAEARRAHRGFRMPPPEVFDALLLGRRSLVTPAAGPTSERGWQFSPTGELQGPGRDIESAAASDLHEAVDQIQKAGAALAQALDIVSSPPVFALLADGLSVLATTPAWADVERAMRSMPSSGSRNKDGGDDMRTVVDFHAMLAGSYGTVVRAVCAGEFFAGLSATRDPERPGPARRRGLSLLAEGLQFAEADLLRIGAKLTRLQSEHMNFVQRHGQATPVSRWPVSLQRTALAQAPSGFDSDLAFAAAGVAETAALPGDYVAEAWQSARLRLTAYCRAGQVDDASFAELVCASASQGPGRWLTLDPRRMTLQQWSQLCFAALRADTRVPAWLAVIALQRLGVDALSPAQQDQLLEVLVEQEQRQHETPLVMATARRDGAWKPSGRGLGSRILVRKQNSPMTENWAKPPTKGLVLIATIEDVNGLLGVKGWLSALPRPLKVQREEPMDKGEDFGQLRLRIRTSAESRSVYFGIIQRVGASVVPRRDDSSAALVDPGGPDDLFSDSGAG